MLPVTGDIASMERGAGPIEVGCDRARRSNCAGDPIYDGVVQNEPGQSGREETSPCQQSNRPTLGRPSSHNEPTQYGKEEQGACGHVDGISEAGQRAEKY